MSNKKDYYEILGVTKDASADEIKKKYRTAAMKWHPDRWANGTDEEKKAAEEKFKDIAEAYEVLSDPQKRQMYDNGGMDFDADGGFDPMDIFRRMAEEGGFGSMFGGFGHRSRVNRGADIVAEVEITLKEAYDGVSKSVEVKRPKQCSHCHGVGSEDGKDTTCPDCHGSGFIRNTRRQGNMFFTTNTTCPKCHGTGKVITNPCHKCGGSGIEYAIEHVNVDIPSGVSDGMTLIMEGGGAAPEGGGINGNLNIVVSVKDDNYFSRPDQFNIVHYEDVPFTECLLGFKKEFNAIDGTKVTVNAPELTRDGQPFYFRGKGMPDINGRRPNGDYAVVIRYKMPNKLTKEQREKLKNF